VWQGRFKSPVIQNDEHLLTVLRYIEANPLRAALVMRAEEYPWSSYRVHGLGEADELIDRLITYEALSPRPSEDVDEGTAIYKVANETPVGKHFVTYEGLPSDWHLKLTGAATKMIRGESPCSERIPEGLAQR